MCVYSVACLFCSSGPFVSFGLARNLRNFEIPFPYVLSPFSRYTRLRKFIYLWFVCVYVFLYESTLHCICLAKETFVRDAFSFVVFKCMNEWITRTFGPEVIFLLFIWLFFFLSFFSLSNPLAYLLHVDISHFEIASVLKWTQSAANGISVVHIWGCICPCKSAHLIIIKAGVCM